MTEPEGSTPPPTSSPSRLGSVSLILGGLVSLGFLGFFLSGIDYASLMEAIRTANYGWAGLGMLLFMGTYPIRAHRWKSLLHHGPAISFRTRLSATTIGFMASNVFPGRAGEFVRATVLALRSEEGFASAFASIVVERLFDLIVVLMFLAYILVSLPGTQTGAAAESLEKLAHVGQIFGLFTLVMLAGLVLLKVAPDGVLKLVGSLLFFLDEATREKVLTLIRSIVQGLTVLSGPLHVVGVFVLSLIHWGVAILGIHVTLWAFHLDPPVLASVMVFVFTALAVALPQAPGFIGVWQVAAEQALAIVGTEVYAAKGFALICWAANIVPVTLVGFLFLSMEGLNMGSMLEQRSRPSP